jgi:dTMP kinase
VRSNRETLQGFIVLEGLDGSGTTTQTDLLCTKLASDGFAVAKTSEPTEGPFGRALRDVLADRTPALPGTVAYLFAADRNEHVNDPVAGIRANVAAGRLVVSDRYLFSSLAYQTVDVGWDLVEALNGPFPLPEIVIFLDLAVDKAIDRLSTRTNREIYEYSGFQERVRANYRRAFELYAEADMRILRVDGSLEEGAIHEQIYGSPPIRSILER